jgi:voltage-gated potassium channel
MKSLAAILSYLSAPIRRRDLRVVLRLLALFVLLVASYTVIFHVLMEREGQQHSWATSVYWTLVTMTTLGFGDITFTSDAGRIFSVVVLLSGVTFLLVLLPFTFIQFVFVPWMERRAAARAPRRLPADTHGHLILTALGPIEDALIRRAKRAGVPYVLLVGELEEALRLHDRGYRVMVGLLDDPDAYRAARIEAAALVAATRADTANTNIVFTIGEISADVPVIATASARASVDILELAGADQVLQLGVVMGRMMAQRVLGTDARSHVIGSLAGLSIAEAGGTGSPLVGQTLAEAQIRARSGVSIIGVWDRGRFQVATAETRIERNTVLILAGDPEQLARYDELYGGSEEPDRPVVVIGGGRVGRQVGRSLAEDGIEFKIIEKLTERVRDPSRYVVGDAAELAVLEEAGIGHAGAVVITTHDDDVNVYLTIYCRRLRPDMQVIARANLDRNVTTLYRAGADAVLSYASIGATAIWNRFRADDTLFVAEGLDVLRVPVPPSLVGKTLAESHLRAHTGCTVVAVARHDSLEGNPDAWTPLPAEGELILIGDAEDHQRFVDHFGLAERSQRRARATFRPRRQ